MLPESVGSWASENILLLLVIAAFIGSLTHSEKIWHEIGVKAWYVYIAATFGVCCVVILLIWNGSV